MKQCPSCNSEIDDTLDVCPSCGFHFGEEGSPNRTVMGIPAVDLEDSDPEPAAEIDTNSTLFGFPALDENEAEPEEDLEEDSYEEFDETEATHLIPAEQLQKEFEADERRDAMVERSDIEGTVAGAPAVGDDSSRVKDAWGLDESSVQDDSSTAVAPASLLGGEPDFEEGTGFSKTKIESDGEQQHGTLMGMSLNDFEDSSETQSEHEEPNRATQFAIPAVQRGDADEDDDRDDVFETHPPVSESAPTTEPLKNSGPPTAERERADSSEHDAPTAMWSPADEIDDSDDPARKELLAKIRSGLDEADKKRSTSQSAKPSPAAVDRPSGKQAGVAPDGPATTPSEKTPTGPVDTGQPGEKSAPAKPSSPGKKPGQSSTPQKSKLPDASELRARLKAKREALKTSRTAVGPDSIPEPNQSPNPKNFDDVERMTDERREDGEPPPKKSSGVLGVSYIRGKGDVAPEAPTKRTRSSVDKLRIDTGEVPTADPEDLELDMQPVESTAESSEFEEDFAFADTNVASPQVADQFRKGAADISAGGSGLFDQPATPQQSDGSDPSEKMKTDPTGPDPSLFSTEPDLGRQMAETEKDILNIDNHPTQPRSLTPASHGDTTPDQGRPTLQDESSPARPQTQQPPVASASQTGFGSHEQPAQHPAQNLPRQAPPNQAMQATGGQPPAASSQSDLYPAPAGESEVAQQDARLFQTGFAILAGLGLLAAGAWGAAIAQSLMISIGFLFAALLGLLTLTAAALPLPPKFKSGMWALTGILQVAINVGLLVLEMSPAAPTVLAVCAGFGALMAVVFPLVTKQLG